VSHPSAGGNLSLRNTDILKQLGALKQRLVLTGINQHGGAPTMLRQDHGSLGALYLPHHRREIGAKVREGADVLGRSEWGHDALD